MIRFFLALIIVLFNPSYGFAAETKKGIALPPFFDTMEDTQALEKDPAATFFLIEDLQYPIHGVKVGAATDNIILYIHGSPGSWTAWAEYLRDNDLRQNTTMIAIDRPAFGRSNFGQTAISLEDQAEAIYKTVQTIAPNSSRITLVGHSYGGPVALRLAVDYPNFAKSIVLLAPAISPDITNPRWYNHVAKWWLVQKILPRSLTHSNREMIPLNSELKLIEPLLKNVNADVFVVQGAKDKLVNVGNAAFAKEALIHSDVSINILPDAGHFIPWEYYDVTKQTILDASQ